MWKTAAFKVMVPFATIISFDPRLVLTLKTRAEPADSVRLLLMVNTVPGALAPAPGAMVPPD